MTVGEVEEFLKENPAIGFTAIAALRVARTRLNRPLEKGETSQDRIAKVGRWLEEQVTWVDSKMPPGSIPRRG